MKVVIAIAVVVLLALGFLAWRTMADDGKPVVTPTKTAPGKVEKDKPESADDEPVKKKEIKGRDPNRTPFDDGTIGRGIVGCQLMCKHETKCKTQTTDCEKECKSDVELRGARPTCAAELTTAMQCKWQAVKDCGSIADACAGAISAATDCICKLPNPPASCK